MAEVADGMTGEQNGMAKAADRMMGARNRLKCERIVNEPLMKKDIY